jgi:hypothetical protein
MGRVRVNAVAASESFRVMKQTLKIARLVARSENAVRIQIAVALIAYPLLRTLQKPAGWSRRMRSESRQNVRTVRTFPTVIEGEMRKKRTSDSFSVALHRHLPPCSTSVRTVRASDARAPPR